MDIEPFLVGSALDCVVAQRLARRLCDKCKQPYAGDFAALHAMGFVQPGDPQPTLFRPVGCAACSKTGYRGRLDLHEVLAVPDRKSVGEGKGRSVGVDCGGCRAIKTKKKT